MLIIIIMVLFVCLAHFKCQINPSAVSALAINFMVQDSALRLLIMNILLSGCVGGGGCTFSYTINAAVFKQTLHLICETTHENRDIPWGLD